MIVGLATEYRDRGCAAGAVGRCDGVTGGDFGALVATVYFYPDYTADIRAICEDAGGSYRPL